MRRAGAEAGSGRERAKGRYGGQDPRLQLGETARERRVRGKAEGDRELHALRLAGRLRRDEHAHAPQRVLRVTRAAHLRVGGQWEGDGRSVGGRGRSVGSWKGGGRA